MTRERVIPLAGIAGASLLAWLWLVAMARDMDAMAAMMQVAPRAWSPGETAAMLVMWWVMMVAMMLPSATMMILTVARISRRRGDRATPVLFASGYLIAWGGFSILATGLQFALETLALLGPVSMAATAPAGGVLLVLAGIYQFTPLKHACLRHCRSPLSFVLNRWRDGRTGAVAMGTEHGAYCLGCCWVLMLLLFVFGVMNLLWIAALTIAVLVEKAVPGGPVLARIAGAGMIAAGSLMIAGLA